MKIVQFKNGRFGVRRWSMFVGLFGGYEFLDSDGDWVRKQGYNIGSIECYTKESADRRAQEYIESENSYRAYKNNARDMGKPVK